MAQLSAGERDFFDLVTRAAYANPFGRERAALNARFADLPGDDPDPVDRLTARLKARLAALDGRLANQGGVAALSPDDRLRVEHATFFEVFHRFALPFDALIEAQRADPSRSVAVPFAADVLLRMAGRGVAPARAERLLGLFWQMRRAFYFIDRGLVGGGPSMRALREGLWNHAVTVDVGRYERLLCDRMEDFSTLLLGETGSGKGAAAAALGQSGFIPWRAERGAFAEPFNAAFVPLNLSAYAESLLESELFGHRKGAFTGAIDDHRGALARCSAHGSVFLDEIGEVAPTVQVKLLKVLEDRTFHPVGDPQARRFAGRIIAATHRDLDQARAEGRFRDDFYYRLCSDVVRVPPLRVRLAEEPGELKALLAALLGRMLGARDAGDREPLAAEVQQVAARVAERVQAELPAHPWPGNVRELAQVARRVLLTGRAAPGEAATAPPADAAAEALAAGLRAGLYDADGLLDRYCAMLYAAHGTYEAVARITGLDRRTARKRALRGQGIEG